MIDIVLCIVGFAAGCLIAKWYWKATGKWHKK